MLRAGRDAPAEAIGGLSAFPLTPLTDATVDEPALGRIVERLNHGRVDSITVLGSTGVGVYLDRAQQQRVVEVAVAAAGGVPVIAGISSLTTRDVLHRAAAAERAGAAALLLAPVSYHPLTEHEVHGLYADVAAEVSLPIVVYDNPTTTGFTFTDDLSARITALPRIASVKIPPVAGGLDDARTRISTLRAQLPDHVSIGTSGDAGAADALLAGATVWYSVLAGLLPHPCRAILQAAVRGDAGQAHGLSGRLEPLWALFAQHGSLRVVSLIAADLGLAGHDHLPRPLEGLRGAARDEVRQVVAGTGAADPTAWL